MNDASHRGPGLGRGWEKTRVQYHESIISQQAVATYVPLAPWRGRGGGECVHLGKGTSGLSTNATHHAMQRPAALSHRPVKGPFFASCQPSPVPRYSEHDYSGAKRICSFQLRRYLVVMHAWSTAQPSNVGPVVGPPRTRCCSCRKEKAKQPSVPSSGSAQERGVSPLPVFLLCARQADGFSMRLTGGPKESRPPSDYNTPPSRSSSEPFLTSLFSTTIRPSLSLSLSKARKLIPLSWDRRRIFLLFVSSLPFYLSSPVFVPPGPANRRLVSLAPISPRWSRRPPQKPVHASTVITSVGGRFRASRLLCECGLELQGGAMVNRNAEAGEPREAPAQQRRPAPAMLDRDLIFAHRHLDSHLAHAAQGPGIGITERFKSPGGSPLQLPAHPYRGLHCSRGYGPAK